MLISGSLSLTGTTQQFGIIDFEGAVNVAGSNSIGATANWTGAVSFSTAVSVIRFGNFMSMNVSVGNATGLSTSDLVALSVLPTGFIPAQTTYASVVVTDNGIDQVLGEMLIDTGGNLTVWPFGQNAGRTGLGNFTVGTTVGWKQPLKVVISLV
jgi:hypothetical protein